MFKLSGTPLTTTTRHAKETSRLYGTKINHRYTLSRASQGSGGKGIMEDGPEGELEDPALKGTTVYTAVSLLHISCRLLEIKCPENHGLR
ncbi:hypothetical protein E2C01_073059 [Portunus trituberculatus]|uniref:Uncharacterized protein n=1 Tax=Portunus trituberculatus TaxID=210409 RepID=A0A5B7I1S8_PORTR|nr:hypothetical protein [Portunus trituberculatus]